MPRLRSFSRLLFSPSRLAAYGHGISGSRSAGDEGYRYRSLLYEEDRQVNSVQFDLVYESNHRFYAIEPTVVEDAVIHVLISLKYEMWGLEKLKRDEYLGAVAIPVCDGDTKEGVFDTAIAVADFGERSEKIDTGGDDYDRIRRAYAKYLEGSKAKSARP
ncbi:hypothetical protein [Bradyrhizobium elkanii]|uniref:hypothetical protein n=1 Tax=Bradyrhizobium elkanii TaxID=29448 RepID=UPI001484E803|nr:hypothetical protein [Bradyrhizobium elkanii]